MTAFGDMTSKGGGDLHSPHRFSQDRQWHIPGRVNICTYSMVANFDHIPGIISLHNEENKVRI